MYTVLTWNIYVYVMQEIDFNLSLKSVYTIGMKSWVGIEGGEVRQNIFGVGINMKV